MILSDVKGKIVNIKLYFFNEKHDLLALISGNYKILTLIGNFLYTKRVFNEILYF